MKMMLMMRGEGIRTGVNRAAGGTRRRWATDCRNVLIIHVGAASRCEIDHGVWLILVPRWMHRSPFQTETRGLASTSTSARV